MTHDHEHDPAALDVTRRAFLASSLLVAGAGVLPRLFERPALAADDKPAPRHPLDPLSADEIVQAVKVLRAGKKLGEKMRFVSCDLHEPAKDVVAAFKPGEPVPRSAFLVLLDNATGLGHEAVVDLGEKKVVRFEALPRGIQPPIMLDEFGECEEAVKKSPEFQAALKKRGVKDVDLVMVEPWSAGNYGT